MASPTWYELLGVSAEASPAQIKAAWRAVTDTFEPGSGSGQFRLFNEAADVLLDPARRAEYDAELTEAGRDDPPEVPGAASVSLTKEHSGSVATLDRGVGTSHGVGAQTPAPTEVEAEHPEDDEPSPDDDEATARPAPGWARVLTSSWLTATVAVLTVLVIAAGAVLWYQNHRHEESRVAGQEAVAAAQRALPVVLSYDYRHLTADRDQAVKFLTPTYRREYTATFDKLIKTSDGKTGPAAQTSAVVKATVRDVGVVDAESDLAKVIVFVDQATVKNGGTPKYSLNRLTVSMVKSGNAWLVNNINSY